MKKKKLTTIEKRRESLAKLTTDWMTDNSYPPNYIRETGTGVEVARVDVWCGGYQDAHDPLMIGWRAQRGNTFQSGVVMVSKTPAHCSEPTKEFAVAKAKRLADMALKELAK